MVGYGTDTTLWDTAQTDAVARIIQSGLRGMLRAHRWTFLSPTATVIAWADSASATASGTPTATIVVTGTGIFFREMIGSKIKFTTSGNEYTIATYVSSTSVTVTSTAAAEGANKAFTVAATGRSRLPDDFGGIEGELTYEPDKAWHPCLLVPEQMIRRQYQGLVSAGTNPPTMAAVRPVDVDQTTGQRYELYFWPEPDANYTLSYQKLVLISKLDATNLYGLGGAMHEETMRLACLAAAELSLNDEQGPYRQQYLVELEASKRLDGHALAPENFGYNRDLSDFRRAGYYSYRVKEVGYNGVVGSS